AQGTDMPIHRTGRSRLLALQKVAVADQCNRGQQVQRQGTLLFVLIPCQEAFNRTFIAADGALGMIVGLQITKPLIQKRLRRRGGRLSAHCVFSPVSVFSLVFWW